MSRSFSPIPTRVLPALALFEWGAILTYFYLSGRIGAFLHPDFRPLVLIAGVLLLACAAGVARWGAPEGCEDLCGTESGSKSPLKKTTSFAVLLLPIAAAALVSPDRFSAAFIQNRGLSQAATSALAAATMRTLSGDAPASPSASTSKPNEADAAPRAVGILDLTMAARDEWIQKDFEGQRVSIMGQFMPDNAHQFGLVCVLITCCAADAQTLAVQVDSPHIPDLEDAAWVRVVGRVNFNKIQDYCIPTITAEKITPIPSPADTYTYLPTRPTRANRAAHR